MAPDKDAGTPRVFLARHGQTEWTIDGRWTGSTADIPLTQFGESQISSSAGRLVGPGKLIEPEDLAAIFVSPMQRARKTYDMMFEPATREKLLGKVDFTADLVEWGYGDYEGLRTAEIKQLRGQRGLNAKDFDIFKHGCEGGESPEQVTERVDKLIIKIRELHAPNMHGENKACNVLLVAHGHILRAFTRRWLGYSIDFPLSAMLEPGGIGILSYQHHNIEEPAFLLGMALP